MKIKKWVVVGIVGLTAIGTGFFLVTVLFEGLSKYGIKGYFFLVLFVVSLITYIRGQRGIGEKVKIAEQVAEKVSREYQGKIGNLNAESAKAELEKHLKNKIKNESYQIGGESEDEKLIQKAMEVLSRGYPTASASLFKRELLIGHNAATRLMNTLGKRGVLGPWINPLSRKVLINNPKK